MKTVVLSLQLQFEDSIPTALIHREVQRSVATLVGLRSATVRGMPYYMPLLGANGGPSILGVRMSALNNEQARLNHTGQDLHRLHERGGLDPIEAMSIVKCTGYQRQTPIADALQTLYSTPARITTHADTGLD